MVRLLVLQNGFMQLRMRIVLPLHLDLGGLIEVVIVPPATPLLLF